MGETSATVLGPIEPGSVIVLQGVTFGSDDDGEGAAEVVGRMMEAITKAVGHERYAVLWFSEGGTPEVWGPETDFVGRIRDLLAERA